MTADKFPSKTDVSNPLQDVLRYHCEIAAVVAQHVQDAEGRRKRALRSLSHWFAQQPAPTPAAVMQRADALAVCVPLLEPASRGRLETWEIEDAVCRSGVPSGVRLGQRYRFLQGLAYPLIVLGLCGIIVICFSLFLVPEFDAMFREFELDLPPLTRLLIGLSYVLREWGALLLGIVCVAGLLAFWIARRRASSWMNTKRDALAGWAQHVSLLLRAGLSDADAVLVAGQASEHTWLSRQSQIWGGLMQQGHRPFDAPLFAGSTSVAMIGYAMRRGEVQDRIGWLDEVAEMYRERDRFRWFAWLAWLTPLTVFFVGTVVMFLILALFMPLVGLISGLS